MEKIINKFETLKNTPSDINEHLITLKEYSEKCEHLTEMGVRCVTSTWALLISKPNKMISYDIVKYENINEVIDLSKEYGINFNFITADVLKIDIEETELLFIDTLHTYKQLIQELTLHSKKVSKYIILHDTETFNYVNENIYSHASELAKNDDNTKHGLKTAIQEFLNDNDGENWIIEKEFTNNNGLTILKRIK